MNDNFLKKKFNKNISSGKRRVFGVHAHSEIMPAMQERASGVTQKPTPAYFISRFRGLLRLRARLWQAKPVLYQGKNPGGKNVPKGTEIINKPFFLQFPVKEQMLFTKRLSVLIQAGVPILQALRMIELQASSAGSRYLTHRFAADVEQGQLLSTSLAKYKGIFNNFFINIVRIGEASGTLHENLDYLAQEQKKRIELKSKVTSALVYPGFVVAATFGMTGLLTGYVFPKIMPVFASFKFQLPWTTKTLIALSNVLAHDWEYVLLAMVFVSGVLIFLSRQPRVKLWSDRTILIVPFLGELARSYFLANFCRTLGLLLRSNLAIVEAAKITATTLTSSAYAEKLELLPGHLLKGEKMSACLERYPRLFPVMLTQMVVVGEVTGNLSNTLLYLAGLYEDELGEATKNLTTIIEPVLMIFMGLIVGFVAISIITPIYGITQNLRH